MSSEIPESIPLPTIRRYPEYLIVLESRQDSGESWVSATELGRELDRKSIVVRKDLAYSGIAGSARNGWPLAKLIPALRKALGWDNTSDAFQVDNGIGGIWNFAPVKLKVPELVVVKREDLSLGLAILSYRISGQKNLEASNPDQASSLRS